MVPHDQQLEVGSAEAIRDDLDSEVAIQNFGRTRRARPLQILFLNNCVLAELSRADTKLANSGSATAADKSVRSHTLYAENDVPQPQDFDEFGFTNTKPCCIRVSW